MPFRLASSHLRTKRARSSGSEAEAGAIKVRGCSAQDEGNSVVDLAARTKGGAVMLERSPGIVAMDWGDV